MTGMPLPKPAAALALALSLSAPAYSAEKAPRAPEAPVYTFVALWDAPAVHAADFSGEVEKQLFPVLERQLTEGAISGWGAFEQGVRKESGFSHGLWFASSSIAQMERARVETLKLPFPLRSRSHVFRALVHRAKAGKGSGYLWVRSLKLLPGAEDEWLAGWEKSCKPLYEDLMAKGVLAHYEVETEQFYTADPAWRHVVATLPSAEAADKALEVLGAGECGAAGFYGLIAAGSHRDLFASQRYAQK